MTEKERLERLREAEAAVPVKQRKRLAAIAQADAPRLERARAWVRDNPDEPGIEYVQWAVDYRQAEIDGIGAEGP